MNAIVAIARADLQERTRTFGILIVIAGLLQLGYLFVPDRSAMYSTVDLGGWRGIYDSAWMGTSTALLTVAFLPLFGFFLVRPAQSRDVLLGTYDLVASAALPRVLVVLGKFASNVALLAAFSLLLQIAAVAMQFVRGEDRTLDLLAYTLPFAIVTIPACIITASAAVLLDSIPALRGFIGGIAWFFLWTTALVAPLAAAHEQTAAIDPLGVTLLTAALFHGLTAALPHVHIGNNLSLGVGDATKHVFRFPVVVWTSPTIAVRIGWSALAVLLVAAASPYALATAVNQKRSRFIELPTRLARLLPLPPLVRIELAAALGAAGPLWLVGMLGLTIAAMAVPADALARAIAPLVWVWPIGPMAAASVVDTRARCEDVLRATPAPTLQRAVARTSVCFLLAAVPVVALALRDGVAGSALLAIALATAAVAVVFGTILRSPLTFEAAALLVWYLGAVNHLPALDPASTLARPTIVIAICGIVCGLAILATSSRMGRRT